MPFSLAVRDARGARPAAFERNERLDACIIVRDAHELSQSLTAANVTFTVPLRQMPYGSEFYVRDPDGYILGFVQPAPDEVNA